MPRSLLPRAPMIPATCVPWPCLSSPDPLPSTTSPPKRSSTTPLPSSSRPLDGSLVFSHRLDFRSGWLDCTPVSSTATFAQLVRSVQAPGASMSWSSFCLIAYCSLMPGSLAFFKMAIAPSSSTRSTRSLAASRARRSSRLIPSRARTASARTRRNFKAIRPPSSRTIFSRRASFVSLRNWTSRRVTGGVSPRGFASRSLRNSMAAAGEATPASTTLTTKNIRTRRGTRTSRHYQHHAAPPDGTTRPRGVCRAGVCGGGFTSSSGGSTGRSGRLGHQVES